MPKVEYFDTLHTVALGVPGRPMFPAHEKARIHSADPSESVLPKAAFLFAASLQYPQAGDCLIWRREKQDFKWLFGVFVSHSNRRESISPSINQSIHQIIRGASSSSSTIP